MQEDTMTELPATTSASGRAKSGRCRRWAMFPAALAVVMGMFALSTGVASASAYSCTGYGYGWKYGRPILR